jgi:proteasome accessory factor A
MVPKLCGADIELGNFVRGVPDSGAQAARALLREVDGVPATGTWPGTGGWDGGWFGHGYDPQDWGRKYLPSNGGSVYVDANHLELALPETRSAFDHVAVWHAMLRIARAAQVAANAARDPAYPIHVVVNNSDGHSHSYGSHLNLLTTARTWHDLFSRRLHHALFLASFQVSAIILTGIGKVGSENRAPAVDYQIAQRADFFETFANEQTMYHRPLLNTRWEPLCGAAAGPPRSDLARLHSIFFDATLAPVATLLKVGLMQIALALIEAGAIDLRLCLDDPLETVVQWSHDPSLRTRAPLVTGRRLTALELQWRFYEHARHHVESCDLAAVVPRLHDILALWEDTLRRFTVRDHDTLARRIDWVAKQHLLERVLARRPHLTWRSPELKHLDLLYGSLDPDHGLYWALERSGAAEPVVSEAAIAHFVREPPADTRAWTRAMLLRGAPPEAVALVDWDAIVWATDGGTPPRRMRVDLPNPLGWTQAAAARHFSAATSFAELLDRLGATPITPTPSAWTAVAAPVVMH